MNAKKTAVLGSGRKPTIASCIEAVLANSEQLMYAVIDGLQGGVERGGSAVSAQIGQSPVLTAAVQTLARQRELAAETFSERLRVLLYAGLGSAGQVQKVNSLHELRLFDEGSLDDSIELAQAEQELGMAVEKSLPQLDALISGLLGWITVQPQINPLRPAIFVHAMRDAIKERISDDAIRAQLITPAAGRLGVALDKLYRKVIDWLLMHGIEPAGPLPNLDTGSAGAQSAGIVSTAVAKTMLTLDKVRRMLTGQSNEQLPSDSLGKRGSGFLHTVPFSLKAIEDGDMLDSMVAHLDRQAQDDPAALAQRQEQARAALKGGGNIGKLLGSEVTRVMLDQLMQDERLLPKVRALLRALEPSLLDVAENDVRFFADEHHAARQYLSQLTDRALGFSHETEEGFAPYYRSIQESVGVIVREHLYLTDKSELTAVYELALRDLLEVWERADAVAMAQQAAAAKALLLAEQRNVEAQRLASEFHDLLEGIDVPDVVRGFVTGVWSQVVAKSIVGTGKQGGDPQGYLALVGDLLWSVQPSLAQKDRQRLVNLIPGLLSKLRLGAKSIDYPTERLGVLFDALLQLHEKALGERQPKQQEHLYRPVFEHSSPISQWETSRPSLQAEGEIDPSFFGSWGDSMTMEGNSGASPSAFIDIERQEQKLQVSSRAAPMGEAAETGQENPSPAEVLRIDLGSWVELKIKGQWTRAQLSWQSPKKTMFVFVTGSGTAHSMSGHSLEALLAQGKLRVISGGNVLDGAWDVAASRALRNAAQSGQ